MTGRRAAPDNEAVKAGTLREHKEVSERAFLVQKLRETGWNISKTAELIDTPRSNLYKKLEQSRHQAGNQTDSRSRARRPPLPSRGRGSPGTDHEGEESPNSAGQCAG